MALDAGECLCLGGGGGAVCAGVWLLQVEVEQGECDGERWRSARGWRGEGGEAWERVLEEARRGGDRVTMLLFSWFYVECGYLALCVILSRASVTAWEQNRSGQGNNLLGLTYLADRFVD